MKINILYKVVLIITSLIVLQSSPVNSQQIIHQWIKSAGGVSPDQAVDLTIDNSNNLFVTGMFFGETQLGKKKLISDGSSDIFLAQFNDKGKLIWAKKIGGTSIDCVHSIQLDSKGNVYLCGQYRETCRFDEKQITTTSFADNFIAKYSGEGSLLWVKPISANTKNKKSVLAIDDDDNIYYAGSFYKKLELENKKLYSKSGSDIFISKIDPNGNLIEILKIGGLGHQELKTIKCDQQGQVYIAGSFDNEIEFGEQTIQSYGKRDIFIARIDSSEIRWIKQAGGNYDDFADNIAINNNEIYISGSFTQNALFENKILISEGVLDAFLASYDLNGKLQWVQKYGGAANEYVNSMLVAKDNIYLSGSYRGNIQKKNYELKSDQFSKDVYLTKFDKKGNYLWTESFGGTNQDFAVKLLESNDNYFYQIGSYSKNIKIGKDEKYQEGNIDDFFINKFYDCGLSTQINLGDDCTLCKGDTLKAVAGFKSYKWNNGSAKDNIVVEQSGIYKIKVTDKHGCEGEDEIKVDVADLPKVSLGNDIVASIDETVILGTKGEYNSYLWSDGSTDKTLVLPPTKTAKTDRITLSATNKYGCTATDEVIVYRKAVPAQCAEYNVGSSKHNQYHAYPNPTDGVFFINTNEKTSIKKIEIINLLGNTIKTYKNIERLPFKIDLTGQNNGIYSVKLYHNETDNVVKVLLKK